MQKPRCAKNLKQEIQQLQLSSDSARRAGMPRLQNTMEGLRQAQILTAAC
ncbi:hypothetical protein L914_12070 [Phytophthora nicotianae]|uniref:Uncharacterized protein n=1 Tax=Phytophthora nicotianae TaxID=4792 RepID=W2N117_PHYNI|nr:hypothetical protein L914_12070 [Phytophthora nicotianae]